MTVRTPLECQLTVTSPSTSDTFELPRSIAQIATLDAWVLLYATAVRAVVKRTRGAWDDALVKHKFFARLAQIVPAIVIYVGIGFVPDYSDAVEQIVRNVVRAYMILMLTLTVTASSGPGSSSSP